MSCRHDLYAPVAPRVAPNFRFGVLRFYQIDAANPRFIKNIWGVGYTIEA